MKNNNPLRVAIIGLGAAARNIHFPAYLSLGKKIKLVAGCDPNPAARKIAVEKFNLKEVFDDPFEMIREIAPDVVSICTPPSLHVEQTILALENGCHVFCEKPLAENLSGAVKIARTSEQTNRLVVVNNQFPYMNIHLGAKRMIGSPEFGRLLFLQAWQTFHPTAETESGWRGELRQRTCFEFGVHVFELARFFFEAEPVFISAQMPQPEPEKNSDTLNLITLEFEGGRAASIILNRLSRGPERYLDMRLDGEFASIHTSIGGRVGINAGIHTREKRPFFGIDFVKGGSALLQKGNRAKIIAKDDINPFASATANHFENFIKALNRNNAPLTGTADDNLKTLALVFAAYESAKTRCAVNIKEYMTSEVESLAYQDSPENKNK